MGGSCDRSELSKWNDRYVDDRAAEIDGASAAGEPPCEVCWLATGGEREAIVSSATSLSSRLTGSTRRTHYPGRRATKLLCAR